MTLETVRELLPVFVSVTFFAALIVFVDWLPKIRLEADSVAVVAAVRVPVPVAAALCGLPAALSVTTTEALRAPCAEG